MSATPGFELLDHQADIGVRAVGATLAGVFVQTARGLFSVMIALDAVRPIETLDVDLRSAALDQLLIDWLGELLAQKDLSGCMFSRFEASVRQEADGWRLTGRAMGEPLDVGRHDPRVEVKGISHLGLSVQRERGQWVARVVLDV